MRRRRFLSALIGGVALAGCQSSQGESPDTPTSSPTATTDGFGAAASTQDAAATATATPLDPDRETPRPTPVPGPRPDPIQFLERGSSTTERFSIRGDGPTIFEIGHQGEDTFTVKLYTDSGRSLGIEWRSLVAAVGDFAGSVMVGLSAGDYHLEVQTEGLWGTVIRQPAPPTSGAPLPHGASAVGPLPIGPVEFTGETRLALIGSASDEYAIWVLDTSGDHVQQVWNGAGRGPSATLETSFRADRIGYVQVETTGKWSIDLKLA